MSVNDPDTLPGYLFDMYGREHTTSTWDDLTEKDKAYWNEQAKRIRRAVLRADTRLARRLSEART